MTKALCALGLLILLPGCVAGPLIENLSLKGKPIETLEHRYGPPARTSQGRDESTYVWLYHAGLPSECRMNVSVDNAGRITSVQTVGRMSDCNRLRHPPRR